MATRLVIDRRNIADSVASRLSLQAPETIYLQREGVSRAALLRALACAWEWLEKIPHWDIHRDEHLMSLALVRMGLEMELTVEQAQIAMQLFGTEEEQPVLRLIERRLRVALPIVSEMQPLARATTDEMQPLVQATQDSRPKETLDADYDRGYQQGFVNGLAKGRMEMQSLSEEIALWRTRAISMEGRPTIVQQLFARIDCSLWRRKLL